MHYLSIVEDVNLTLFALFDSFLLIFGTSADISWWHWTSFWGLLLLEPTPTLLTLLWEFDLADNSSSGAFFYLIKDFRTIWARFLPLWVFLMGMIDSAWGPSKLLAEPASNKYFFRRSLLLLRISWKLHIIWGLDSQNLLCLRLLLVCFAHVIEEHFDKSLL